MVPEHNDFIEAFRNIRGVARHTFVSKNVYIVFAEKKRGKKEKLPLSALPKEETIMTWFADNCLLICPKTVRKASI